MIRLRIDQTTQFIRSLFDVSLQTFIALAIVAYFSGWNYVFTYFSHFGINRSSFSFDHYTVFLYSFFVLVKVPSMLVSLTTNALLAFSSFLVMLLIAALEIVKPAPALIHVLQRILVIVLGVACLFFFSIEAGNRDAERVAVGNEARPVSVILSSGMEYALAKQYGPDYARVMLCEMKRAGKLGGLALIWRNSEESIFSVFETTAGAGHGDRIATYRIPNRLISLIESKPIPKEGDPKPIFSQECS